jgi:hypothetical protein
MKFIITQVNGKKIIGDGKDIIDIIEQAGKVLVVAKDFRAIEVETVEEQK